MLAVVVVWIAGALGLTMPDEVAAAIAGLAIALVLFAGRRFKLTGTTVDEARYDARRR